jgi:hypothetical protein
MVMHPQNPPAGPHDAFWQYILELERDYQTWYQRSSRRTKWGWGLGQGITLTAGFAASLLAALTSADVFTHSGWVRAALVFLPALGAIASSLVSQTRVRELLTVRERGREAIQALISRARADYAASANDPARCHELHAALVSAVSELERQQATDFFLTAPGADSFGKPEPTDTPAALRHGAGQLPGVPTDVRREIPGQQLQ